MQQEMTDTQLWILEQTDDFEWLDHSLFSSSPVLHGLISKYYGQQYNPEKPIFIKNSLNYWGLRNTVLRNPLTNSNDKSREIIFHFFLYFLHIYQLPWIIFIYFFPLSFAFWGISLAYRPFYDLIFTYQFCSFLYEIWILIQALYF